MDSLGLADRLSNEAAVLRFLAENTTIPVPTVLGLWIANDVHLKMSLTPANGIQLSQVDKSFLPAAIAKVSEELESKIFPQIRKFRRNYLGSVDPAFPIIPPPRLRNSRDDRVWKRVEQDIDKYVFCHNDLHQDNIFIDPVTFAIVSIIDWEYAGFYPPEFELPLWTIHPHEIRHITRATYSTAFSSICLVCVHQPDETFYPIGSHVSCQASRKAFVHYPDRTCLCK